VKRTSRSPAANATFTVAGQTRIINGEDRAFLSLATAGP
jgi:hypothetical protein